MKCAACNFENRRHVVFCEECGHRVDATCQHCAAIVPAGARFCPQCGVLASIGGAKVGATKDEGHALGPTKAATTPAQAFPTAKTDAKMPHPSSPDPANGGGVGKALAFAALALAVAAGTYLMWEEKNDPPPLSIVESPPLQIEQDLPLEVRQFVERTEGCLHWMGEPPYDEEREAEIESKLKSLRCDEIESLQKELLSRYQGNPVVLNALTAAWTVDEPATQHVDPPPASGATTSTPAQALPAESARNTPTQEVQPGEFPKKP